MLTDNHMRIIIFTLRQPIGWLNWYHPSIDYDYFFKSCSLEKQGSITISLIGYPTNCWIKMEWVSSLYSTLFNCFNHAHVSSKVVPPYTFGIKPPILSRISIFLFKYSISPLFHVISTSTSYIHKCNILGLGQKKMTISWVLGEVLPKSRFRFLRLDLPWDFGKKLPMSGCINSHVDLGNSLITIFYMFFSRNGFRAVHFEI